MVLLAFAMYDTFTSCSWMAFNKETKTDGTTLSCCCCTCKLEAGGKTDMSDLTETEEGFWSDRSFKLLVIVHENPLYLCFCSWGCIVDRHLQPRENKSEARGPTTSNRRWDLCQGFQSAVALSKPPGHYLWNCLSRGQAPGSALQGRFSFEDMVIGTDIFRKLWDT